LAIDLICKRLYSISDASVFKDSLGTETRIGWLVDIWYYAELYSFELLDQFDIWHALLDQISNKEILIYLYILTIG